MSPPKNSEYQGQWQSRRDFLGKVALASSVVGGLGYLCLAPEEWSGSRKDAKGLRGLPQEERAFDSKTFECPSPTP